jgi:hypothetical protein
MRPVFKQFACAQHGHHSHPHLCPACSEAVKGYRQAVHAWRLSEAAKMRAQVRQKKPKTTKRIEISAAEQAMDETRWREGLRATRASQPDTPERRAKRVQQIANMRQLRAHRKRMLDIGQVYRSDMYPRHFRRAAALLAVGRC